MTWRELVLLSVGVKLVGKTVPHRTDNMNVEHSSSWWANTSTSFRSPCVCTLYRQYQVHLEPDWIQREFNQKDDELSWLATKSYNTLNPNIFAVLDV